MSNNLQPDMQWDWRPRPVVSPRLPQNNVAPVWGAIGTPTNPTEAWNPHTPAAVASKIAGFSGLGEMTLTPLGYARLGLGLVCLGASAYHGYKRHRGSVGYGALWGLSAAFFPIITTGVALYQGFAKPQKR